MTNKELIDKYPWLYIRRDYDFDMDTYSIPENPDYEFTWLDAIPDGWRKAFGEMMVEEIDQELRKHDFVDKFEILQVKEKYGEFRMYCGGAPREVHRIIQKYEVISRHICMVCGKPDVHIREDGWIWPQCRECYEKDDYNHLPYEEVVHIDENPKIPDSYKVTSWSKDEGENVTEYDISETVAEIRRRWEAKCY